MTHGVRKNSVPAKRSLQLTMEGSTALDATTKLHSLVTTYIVQGMLSYSHVESAAFKALLSGLVPGYKPPTASTVKRRLVAMYIVLKCMITEYLISLSVALSVTIDGWSNQVCRGYFACTLHWMDTRIEQLCSCTLDFFYVAPGEGVGHRCGHYLTALFTTFCISPSILAIVSDSGSDGIAAANVVVAASVAAAKSKVDVVVTVHMRCYAHTFQLAIRCVTDSIQPALTTLRSIIALTRSGKQRRSMFRSIAAGLATKATAPPCLDTPTRWNSTHVMIKQCIELKAAIVAVQLTDVVYNDYVLEDDDWANFVDVEKFLRVPAVLSTLVGASDTCSISMVNGANHNMIQHCNANVYNRNTIAANASEAMLSNLIDHQTHLSNNVAIIAKFLDPRVARFVGDDDFRADRLIVEEAMRQPRYYVFAVPSAVDVTEDDETNDEDEAIDIFGRVESIGVAENELARYALLPQVDKKENILKWWSTHKAEYPVMYKMAMDYLAIPATSVPSERANSAAKRVFEGRESLGDNMFKAETCCQSWLRLAQDVGLKLPADYLEELNILKGRVDFEEIAKEDIVVQYYLDMK
jgi:hypothetical protein